jgi:hypothetical protein
MIATKSSSEAKMLLSQGADTEDSVYLTVTDVSEAAGARCERSLAFIHQTMTPCG